MPFYTMATIVLLALSACNNKQTGPVFTVTGKIDNAAGKTLYLSNIGIKENIILDSTTIKEDGSYTFSQPQHAS